MKDKVLLKQKVIDEEQVDELLVGFLRQMVLEGYTAELIGESVARLYHIADTTTFEVGYSS